MPTYKAPLRDQRFILEELLGLENLQRLPKYATLSGDIINAILTESERLCVQTLLPLNQTGDEIGCILKEGNVHTPPGFKEAYKTFVDAGWPSLVFAEEDGGQGLPEVVSLFTEEMVCATNLAFGLFPGLTRGAAFMLKEHGSQDLKDIYLKNMVSGHWAGTMCLTEPHCGTDLGLLRTKAVPQEDGCYKITGTKIFISSGDHDLTENIIHFVIARTPEGAKGIRGISLFLVPKFIPNAQGKCDQRNTVGPAALEHKMGIKASPTCVMNFDEATGYLVGEKYKGVANMFTMMNIERLGVGNQGLGLGEISFQNALSYARERLQGRALTGPQFPEKEADPLIVHGDVRRMLLTMKALNEGNRMMAAWVAMELDKAEASKDPQEKQEADDLVQLMTPIIKAILTDCGTEVSNLGVQIYGGHGYVKDHGMEQFVRDARITQLYEGTNGIQALDLIGRKLSTHTGRYLRRFFHPIQQYLEEKSQDLTLQELVLPVHKAFGRLQQATLTVAQKSLKNPDEAGTAAYDYLKLFGLVAVGYLWIRTIDKVNPKVAKGKQEVDFDFYASKIETGTFFIQKILPQNSGLFSSIMAGSKPVMTISDSQFGPF